MDRVVIKHELDTFDPAGAVYRVVHGVEVTQPVAVLDDEGGPQHDKETGQPITQDRVVAYRDERDIVFAADDERWFTGRGAKRTRRPDDEVAAEQLRIIADAFAERADDADRAEQARAAAVRELPGVGEVLPVRPRARRNR
jgi:hypothetical protein